MMTRDDATVFSERRYEPFGQPIDDFEELVGGGTQVGLIDFLAEPLNGLNKPTDPTTGFSYHGARWMASQTARWLTPDPPVKAPDPKFMAQPWALHPYQYVKQNPVLYWDPDGAEDDLASRIADVLEAAVFSSLARRTQPATLVLRVGAPKPTGGAYGQILQTFAAGNPLRVGPVIGENLAESWLRAERGDVRGAYLHLRYAADDIASAVLVGQSVAKGVSQLLRRVTTTTTAGAPVRIPRLTIGSRTSLPGSSGIRVGGRLTPAQMAHLTNRYGVEFALVYRTGLGKNGGGGAYWLYSGSRNRVRIPVGKDVRIIYHTHPGNTPFPSRADRRMMGDLRRSGSPQRRSAIVTGDGQVRTFSE